MSALAAIVMLDQLRERVDELEPGLYFLTFQEQLDRLFELAQAWIDGDEDRCEKHEDEILTLRKERDGLIISLAASEQELRAVQAVLERLTQ